MKMLSKKVDKRQKEEEAPRAGWEDGGVQPQLNLKKEKKAGSYPKKTRFNGKRIKTLARNQTEPL